MYVQGVSTRKVAKITAEHSFERGFLLDEARLRKLHEIVDRRLDDRNSPTYKVYRGDSYSYTTPSLDDVVAEENEDWRQITRLDVLGVSTDDLDLALTFSRKGAELRLTGDERDAVFLLFSDIREFMHNEVATTFAITSEYHRIIVMVLVGVAMCSMILGMSQMQSAEGASEALDASEVVDKLDYLIHRTQQNNGPPRLVIGSMLAMTLLIMLGPTGLLERFTRFV
ncbi:MAG: hypothetical protein ACKVII_24715, partial [Planctomycetales bacterium]